MFMESDTDPIVAIIVLNWNQCDLTIDCLASLRALDYPSSRLQIIVVDNGSVDGTAQTVRARFPEITVLENAENLGFAEGNNVGIRYAMQGPAEFIMLLNNDTIVDKSAVRDLVAVIHEQPRVGIVGPKMLYHAFSDVIWCAGNHIDWRTGETLRLQAEQVDEASDDPPQDVDFITGCCILLRREVIEQIGPLDSDFFVYYEETDWCVRARARGWRIQYVPQARIWHKVSATIGAASPATDYYMNRNVLRFLAKHLDGLSRIMATAYAVERNVATIIAYTAKPDGGRRLPHRNARLLALRDAMLGRWGRMGSDVEAVCDPVKR
jgi:GT2 family glycosyltransferase